MGKRGVNRHEKLIHLHETDYPRTELNLPSQLDIKYCDIDGEEHHQKYELNEIDGSKHKIYSQS